MGKEGGGRDGGGGGDEPKKGGGPPPPPATADVVVQRAAGAPFTVAKTSTVLSDGTTVVEEIVRTVHADGSFTEDAQARVVRLGDGSKKATMAAEARAGPPPTDKRLGAGSPEFVGAGSMPATRAMAAAEANAGPPRTGERLGKGAPEFVGAGSPPATEATAAEAQAADGKAPRQLQRQQQQQPPRSPSDDDGRIRGFFRRAGARAADAEDPRGLDVEATDAAVSDANDAGVEILADAERGEAGTTATVHLPDAYAVDDIVEAQSVMPEHRLVHPDEAAALDKERRKKRAVLFLLSGGAAVAGITLASLAGTGRLGGGNGGRTGPADFGNGNGTNVTREEPDLRTWCLGPNCWVQLGPDLVGAGEGDEFGRMVSLSGDASGGSALAPRMAVSAPESWEGGVDSGAVWVYDLRVPPTITRLQLGANGTGSGTGNGTSGVAVDYDAHGPNVSWAQVGQGLSGVQGDEAVGFLSPDGNRLAVGGWLNDGADGNVGSAGSVRVFELHSPSNGNRTWTPLGDPIYGEEAKESAGRTVALSKNGTVIAVSAQRHAGIGAVRVYVFSNVTRSWTKMGSDLEGDGPDDVFGSSVSISHDGTVVAAGARHNGNNGHRSGHVKIFRYDFDSDSPDWTQMGGDIEGEDDGDRLGSTVALSGDGTTVAVGAPGGGSDDNGAANGNGTVTLDSRGRISVYSYDPLLGDWRRVGRHLLGDAPGDSLSAVSLSYDGSRLAVGSSLADWSEDPGYVRVYDNVGGNWTQLGGTIRGHSRGERFGPAIALSGDGYRLAAGGWTDEELKRRGVARLYELPSLQDVPDIDGEDPKERFGNTVSLDGSGRRLAISATKKKLLVEQEGENGELEEAAVAAGSVRVYDITNDGSLVPVGQEVYGQADDDTEGFLSRDGRRLAVGAKFNNGPNGTMAGAGQVRVFELRPADPDGAEAEAEGGGTWTMLGSPIYGDAPKDKSAKAVAINSDGSVVAIGAPDSEGRGQARVFRYSSDVDAWSKVGSTLYGEGTDDEFGWSAALSDDGSVLAIGARHNTGQNGAYRSGHVRVFRYDSVSGNYTRLGDDVDGEDEGDHLGKMISLSSDGLTLAVSSSGSDDNGEDSGKVRVFRFSAEANEWRPVPGDIHGDGPDDELMRAALSSDGRRLVTAAHSADGYTGYVNVHDWDADADAEGKGPWRRVGGKIWGKRRGENFGWGIALSEDGTRLAVGGPARKAETPMNGVVRLYKLPPM